MLDWATANLLKITDAENIALGTTTGTKLNADRYSAEVRQAELQAAGTPRR